MLEQFNLTAETRQAVAARASARTYQVGRAIFTEGDPGEALGFLLEGKVKLYRLSAQGREKIIHLLGPGELLGEIAVLDGGPQPLTVETMDTSQVALINREELHQLRRRCPDLNELLLATAASRLRTCYRQISSLALKSTYGRIAGRLFKLARDFGVQTPEGVRLDLALTQTGLASLVGSSRETVSRTLADLQNQGILRLSRSHITILDLKRLRQLGRE
ncbi:MAG: Crp/Fnr family transcriptional regulator [Clostridia bacterium]|nr:MAG: Crp/Fnr family transcriptional regulator [Clostridia bacterium]